LRLSAVTRLQRHWDRIDALARALVAAQGGWRTPWRQLVVVK